MLVVPLTVLSGRHANVLIFNPFRNEVERFEPHGPETGHTSFNDVKINAKLKHFVEEIDPTLQYISPYLLCPRYQNGYQYYEVCITLIIVNIMFHNLKKYKFNVYKYIFS